MNESLRHPASYRDPAGFVFRREGVIYRQINPAGLVNWRQFQASGLKEEWESEGLLIPSRPVDSPTSANASGAEAAEVWQPEAVPFISYPYEWSFGMLRDAALLTLWLHQRAMHVGMGLKDASAMNVQFVDGRPVLMDTLSVAPFDETRPWVAYAQFCRNFLAPLALMSRVDVSWGRALAIFPDGIPLELASRTMGLRAGLHTGLWVHLHAHAWAKPSKQVPGQANAGPTMTRTQHEALIQHLIRTVEGLRWEPTGTPWAEYYTDTNYTSAAATAKEATLRRWLDGPARLVWDLGANDGRFSRCATETGHFTVAIDGDPSAVERAYQFTKANRIPRLQPLWVDLTTPSPALGWANAERSSLAQRGPADTVLALALIHHLAIGANLPLPMIWAELTRLGREVIVEWVPKSDSQVQRILVAREDVFPHYTEADFEASIPAGWQVVERVALPESERSLWRVRPN